MSAFFEYAPSAEDGSKGGPIYFPGDRMQDALGASKKEGGGQSKGEKP